MVSCRLRFTSWSCTPAAAVLSAALAVCVGLSLLVLAPRPALAQCSVTIRSIELTEEKTNKKLTTTDLTKYFNKARCQCGIKVRVTIRWSSVPSTTCSSATERFLVTSGVNCLNTSLNQIYATCIFLYSDSGGVMFSTIPKDLDLIQPAYNLMGGPSCTETDLTTYTIYVYRNGTTSTWAEASNITYTVDTKAPSPPVASDIKAGESLVELNFSGPSSGSTGDSGVSTVDTNIEGYQVLCEKVDSAGNSLGPAFSSPPYSPAFDAAVNICGTTPALPDAGSPDSAALDAGAGAGLWPGPKPLAAEGGTLDSTVKGDAPQVDASKADAARDGAARDGLAVKDSLVITDITVASAGLKSLDKRYICSPIKKSAGTVRIDKLTNGVTYHFYAVTIDKTRNPSTLTDLGTATPQLEEDLWERYKRSGGQADGEYCFVATAAYGSYHHPQVRVLRELRDRVLLPTTWGRELVHAYYRLAPGPAAWLARHQGLRPAARALLWPLTLAAAALLYTDAWQRALLALGLGLGLGLLLLRRSRRRRGSRAQREGGAGGQIP